MNASEIISKCSQMNKNTVLFDRWANKYIKEIEQSDIFPTIFKELWLLLSDSDH